MNDGNGQLKSYIDRLVHLAEAKRDNAEDTSEVLKEAKSNGFDPKALRGVVRLKMEDLPKRSKRLEDEDVLQTYMTALVMLADTPLGQSAISRLASNPTIKKAIKGFGTPSELTDDERAKGVAAAFEKDGTRMTIGGTSA